MNMDAADRTNAIWVVVNWEPVSNWLRQQPVNIRLSLNHPRSVRRKYEAATKPPPIVKEDGSKPEKRTKDHVVMELQQKLDAALAIKGAGAMPAGMKAEDYADKIADQMALPTLKRFVTALQKRIVADERQNRIESRRKQPRK